MNKTVVINVVGLSQRVIGAHTPFLNKWMKKGKGVTVKPSFPAVTTTAQYTYLTGEWPEEHGIVGNGWYFREECEVKFWRQSSNLVQAPKIWDRLKAIDPQFTCANMFWWYNMYGTTDYSVTPRPMYPADGRKIPDVYAQPLYLREKLQNRLGRFPLFNFWGPNTHIRASRWIAKASMLVDEWHDPTLTLIYLPHLDYGLQKYGIDFSKIGKDLEDIDQLCEEVVTYYESKGADVVILSEYGITDVDTPVSLNQILRYHGFLNVKEEMGKEILDPGASRAFAVADHQVAHIYVRDQKDVPVIKELIAAQEGVELVLDERGKNIHKLNHERSGELVAIATPKAWFTYYYWLNEKKAPDFARTVDIHRKPGYDPAELFIDPELKNPLFNIGMKLLKRKIGFRTLLDIIPLNPSLVKGSHGRVPESELDWPVFITQKKDWVNGKQYLAPDIYSLLMRHVLEEENAMQNIFDID
ncbi:nucleotide pyrophosphatase/phosphodiesterase family protein [Limibacter armeniacum]|uniref:alkaline phosphatase family protein n=1 Tax=Limibacter armeniacum TaxID=466084 RepID=UPI002FE5DE9A